MVAEDTENCKMNKEGGINSKDRIQVLSPGF